jgi:hypothetical protein
MLETLLVLAKPDHKKTWRHVVMMQRRRVFAEL